MKTSPLTKFVLPAVLLSGALFSALTFPLAAFGSRPLVIELEKEPVFVGELKDVAAPYLGISTLISLGAGVATVAATGWRSSARKASRAEEQLSQLQTQLQAQNLQIQELQLSESQLQKAGLHLFLEEGSGEALKEQVLAAAAKSASSIIPEPLQPVESLPQVEEMAVLPSPAVSAKSEIKSLLQHQPHLATPAQTAVEPATAEVAILPVLSEAQEAQTQLQQLMAKIERIQKGLAAATQPPVPEVPTANNANLVHDLSRRLQQLEMQLMMQKVAS